MGLRLQTDICTLDHSKEVIDTHLGQGAAKKSEYKVGFKFSVGVEVQKIKSDGSHNVYRWLKISLFYLLKSQNGHIHFA